jgi:prepilin signal peptidase PulO-like enzyme (type II secretory pathway)
MDIVLPKSRCPKCQNAISPRDNIPVIGWLRLRGKCRHCQSPISPRYPLVELGVGLLFLAFMYRTLLSGGENLPVRETNLYRGVIWILWYTKWDLVGIYLFQMALLVALWGGTLMEYDGHRWPRRIYSAVAAIGVVAVSLWPRLHPIPLLGPDSTRLEPPLGIGLVSGLAGLVVSGGVAYAISRLVYRQPFVPAAIADPSVSSENSASSHLPVMDADSRRMQYAIAVGLAGLFLGWQTGLAVAVVIGGLLATHSFFRQCPVATTSSLVTLLLFVWRPVFHFVWPRVSVFLPHF